MLAYLLLFVLFYSVILIYGDEIKKSKYPIINLFKKTGIFTWYCFNTLFKSIKYKCINYNK